MERSHFFTLKMATPQQKAFCVLEFAKINTIVTVQYAFSCGNMLKTKVYTPLLPANINDMEDQMTGAINMFTEI